MDLYKDVEKAIRQHEVSVRVDGGIQEHDVRDAIRWVMRCNPDIFWFVHQYRYDKENKTVSLRYQFSKERTALVQKSIDDVVENDFQIDHVRSLNTLEQVTYVYKWLLAYCNYNVNSAYNQNIDSVFVRRNSVCTGYAKAAQYLFKLLGIDSRLVFGRLNGDKEGGRHCWNIVCVDGTCYHLDVCLGDIALEDILMKAGARGALRHGDFNYDCFCVSTEEIAKTRNIEDVESLPACNACLDKATIERLSAITIKERTSDIGCLLSQSGSTADIYLCSKNKNVVLKKFRKEYNAMCVEENGFMKSLVGCKHVLQSCDPYTDINNSIIAVEQSTPIVDLLCSNYYHPTLRGVLMMARDIIKGWLECHERGVLYRDIHICNIFKSNNGIYKLGDFGSCTHDLNRLRERVGSPWFMSPETYANGRFDERSAVYSITSVLYFVLNGLRPPFCDGNNDEEALQMRMNGNTLPVPKTLKAFPKDIAEETMGRLILKGCAYHPSERFSSTDELLHEIGVLSSKLKDQDTGLWATPQLPEDFLKHSSQEACIQRDKQHKFASGEEVERMAATAAPDTDFRIDVDYDASIDNDGDSESIAVLDSEESNVEHDIFVDDVESHCQTMPPLPDPEPPLSEDVERVATTAAPDTDFRIDVDYDASIDNDGDSESIVVLDSEESNVEHDIFIDDVESHCQTMPPLPEIKTVDEKRSTFAPKPSQKDISCKRDVVPPPNDGLHNPVSSSTGNIFAGMRKAIGSIFGRKAKRPEKKDRKETCQFDEVYGSIFAPAETRRKSHLMVQVYLHLLEETEKVKTLAKESQKDAERRDYIPLQCKLRKGDKVDVLLNIHGETLLMSEKKSVVWQGSFTKCSFDYFVPKDIEVDELSCVALLTVNDIPVGEMRFVTCIVETPRQLNTEIVARKYSKVFISYSHLDEFKVKFLHEGLELGGIPHFFDRHYLKAGDVFPQVIQDYIKSADLFILCWSENASKSEYVRKEMTQALERAFPQVKPQREAKLSIYPMNIEPRAELPIDMKEHYHFGEL